MAWDSSREVPWRRLWREWLWFTLVAAFVFAVFLRERRIANYVAIALGGAMYVAIGAILAKFGYVRPTFRELRAQSRAEQANRDAARQAGSTPRRVANRPAPTKRTNAGNRRTRRR